MKNSLRKIKIPDHLQSIPELDLTPDMFKNEIEEPWFRIGAWTKGSYRNSKNIGDEIERQTLLIPKSSFGKIYKKLESIGNVLSDLGKPGGSVLHDQGKKTYKYFPFHKFHLSFTPISGEPVAFYWSKLHDSMFFINPDIILFFGLEEKNSSGGIWYDPSNGNDVIVETVIEEKNLHVVDIRSSYLRKYLKSRQIALLVGQYHHLHWYSPPENSIKSFKQEDVTIGSPSKGLKAIFQNWGYRKNELGDEPYLQRRLHLWFQIQPPKIDVDDPWKDEPPFDPFSFTFITGKGPVSPSRFIMRAEDKRKFSGKTCDFMDHIYFNQQVLSKYEGSSGYKVEDNGSVSCFHYWSLCRSTARIGNELVRTSIGDFAEGVPYEEWPHWQQYNVNIPDDEIYKRIKREQSLVDCINSIVTHMDFLNATFEGLKQFFNTDSRDLLWDGSLDSLAGRQLKWFYANNSNDDEFIKRATLLSTLIIEGLNTKAMRKLLKSIDKDLCFNYETPAKPLGSRNLLQRTSLISVIINLFNPKTADILGLVRISEGKDISNNDLELGQELIQLFNNVRNQFSPLAFLYDLRIYGGLAHAPNKLKSENALLQLGLPIRNLGRGDFLKLVNLVLDSIENIAGNFRNAPTTDNE